MKQLRNITALTLALFVWLGATGYTLETLPHCCQSQKKTCCPLENDETPPECCVIEVDYVQAGSEAVFFSLPEIQFESALVPLPAIPFSSVLFPKRARGSYALLASSPPPKISPKARTSKAILQRVQCWRL